MRAMGHETHSPTLTGVGERRHLARPEVDADLHVEDIVNVFNWRELKDVILVGHSYGGLVITGVAGRIPEKVRALVYLDAVAPEALPDPPPLPGPMGAARSLVMQDLFSRWYDDVMGRSGSDLKNHAAAFQMVIWEISHEMSATGDAAGARVVRHEPCSGRRG